MSHVTSAKRISYTAWILGQTSALMGIILVAIYGFDLVILQARQIYTQNLGEFAAAADAWIPPLGPPLIGLGIALVGWLAAHLRAFPIPAPVLVGSGLNLLALILAIIGMSY